MEPRRGPWGPVARGSPQIEGCQRTKAFWLTVPREALRRSLPRTPPKGGAKPRSQSLGGHPGSSRENLRRPPEEPRERPWKGPPGQSEARVTPDTGPPEPSPNPRSPPGGPRIPQLRISLGHGPPGGPTWSPRKYVCPLRRHCFNLVYGGPPGKPPGRPWKAPMEGPREGPREGHASGKLSILGVRDSRGGSGE